MCGRFAFFSPREAVIAAFGSDVDFGNIDPGKIAPRYNIAPSQDVLLLRNDADHKPVAAACRWGLVPFWARDPAIGNRMINARAETITEKPSYRQSFSRRRCMVLADGFYEWRKDTQGKTPFFISRQDRQPFAMAGIWDEWTKGSNAPLHSCAIITVPANPFMSSLHHRMPVLMGGPELSSWLNPDATAAGLLQMLTGPQTVELQAWPVAQAVNNPVNDSPELAEPL